MEPRRCGVHGLVLGDDNRCVICRRGEEVVEAKTSSDWPIVVFVLVLGALLLAGMGLWLFQRVERGSAVAAGPEEIVVAVDPDPAPSATPSPPATAPRRMFTPEPEESSAAPSPSDEDAEKAKLEAAMKTVPVTMYRRERCAQCDRAKLYMQKQGWILRELDVGASETDLVLLRSINPTASVPTFDVGGQVLVGYERDALAAAVEREAKKKLTPAKR